MAHEEEIDEAAAAVLWKGLQLRLAKLDWREFHFFKPSGGLAKSDLLSIHACFDYEQARESKAVVSYIATLDKHEDARERLITGALRMQNRFVWVGYYPDEKPTKEQSQGLIYADGQLTVPAVSLAAPFFPAPWLSGSEDVRAKITNRLQPIYTPKALPVWDFPVSAELADVLAATVKGEKQTSLHVLAIDHTRPRTSLIRGFEEWLRELGNTGSGSRRGKVKIASALDDLGCYRLATRLNSAARSEAMERVGFRRSANKLSEAKRRALRRLRSLDYV